MLAILPLARKSRKRQGYLDVGGLQGRSVVVLRANQFCKCLGGLNLYPTLVCSFPAAMSTLVKQ